MGESCGRKHARKGEVGPVPNVHCKRAEPAAGPKAKVEMRWGCAKELVVPLGELRGGSAKKRESRADVKTRTARAWRQLQDPKSRQRCGRDGRKRAERIGAGPVPKRVLQARTASGWAEYRGRDRIEVGLKNGGLKGIISDFEMRRTLFTCLGNGRDPRPRGGPGRHRMGRFRSKMPKMANPAPPAPRALGNAAVVMGRALVDIFPAWAGGRRSAPPPMTRSAFKINVTPLL
ncbi:hypothetical protein B0H19DRAFT_1072795 [Mycena capillaripes]|nr:hypothetical protein B0H19DRAFT_1072795 [Mycena capillaripes]